MCTRVCVCVGVHGVTPSSAVHTPARAPWPTHYCQPFIAVGVGAGNLEVSTTQPPVTFSGIPTINLIYPKVMVFKCKERTNGQVQTHAPLCKLCLAQLQGVLFPCRHQSVYSRDDLFQIKDRTAR